MGPHPMSGWLLRTDVELEVAVEMRRADEKHGAQLDVRSLGPLGHYCLPPGEAAKALTDDRFAAGEGTWGDILVEEVCEALDEVDDVAALRSELIQVAAVALRWIRRIDEGPS